jgi:cobalt-zinc-cadmium efflux system outer membrane protein
MAADLRPSGEAGGEGQVSPPPPTGPPMTMDDLWKIAVAANPTLRQAYGLVQQAEGNWLQVGLYPNPSVEWHSEANNAPFDAHYGIVGQEFVTAKKLGLNRGVASSDVQRARWEAEVQNLRVLNDVRIRFIAVLGAQREVAVAEGLLKIADEGVRVSERFFKAEEVSQADVLQATLQLRHTQILLRNARFRAAAAWRELGNVVGRPDLPPRPLAGNLEDEMPEVDWDAAWQQLLGRNPRLHAARARLAAAEQQVRREQVEPVPNLRVSGGTGIDALPAGESFQMAFLSLGAEVPVWDRNQGNILAAMGNLQAARSEVARLELSLRDDLADAFQRYQSARNEVETYRDPILPTAEKNVELTQKAYDEGEFDFLRVLIARRDLFQARIDYVESLTELRSAAIEIHGLLLTGGLDPATNDPTPSNTAGQTADQGR